MQNKRARTEIEPQFLNDCVYSTVIHSGLSKLPICKYALGYLVFNEMNGTASCEILKFPDFFGYLKTAICRQTFGRAVKSAKNLVKNKSDVSKCLKDSFASHQIYLDHVDGPSLSLGVPCQTCFPSNSNLCGTLQARCEKLVSAFASEELQHGSSVKEIYDCLSNSSFKVLSKFDSSLTSLEASLNESKESFKKYKNDLESNLKIYQEHLDKASAHIHYGSGLSASTVRHLDRTIFCVEFTKVEIQEHICSLPLVQYIKSTDPDLDLNDLFNEYCAHVLTHHCEPSFLQLGVKYKLTGREGGQCASRVSDFAQSVCLNYLLLPKNHGVYTELRLILSVNSNLRSRYKPHQLVENLTLPRIPAVSLANEQVEHLSKSNEILLGVSVEPVHHEGWDVVESCPKQISANARLVDLMSIRQHSLKFQDEKKFLRAQPPEHYQKLPIEEVKSKLKSYSLISDHDYEKYDDIYFRTKLQEAECTRSFALWSDHAIILNRSYILFVVWPLYSKSLYVSNDLCEGDLQKAVEQIYIHYVAMCPATTKSEEALHDFRQEQLASLKVKIKTSVGVEFTDRLKFIVGDAPIRAVENGQNKSGPFRNPTLLEPFPMNDREYYQFMTLKHMSFDKTREHANKGGFFDKPENQGKSLQELKDKPECARELMKIRCPNIRVDNKNTEEIKTLLQNELGGTRRPPLYFMKCPSKSGQEIGLEGAELIGNEPLHDMRGHVIKSFKTIPGQQEDETLNRIHEVICNSSNFEYGSKHEKSGETIFKNLIEVVQKLEIKFFSCGLTCNNCGNIFTLSQVKKCHKCLFYTYYRSLLEIHVFAYKDDSKRSGVAALLLHNLIFVMFQSLKEIISIIPDAAKIMDSIYFVDIVFYMGPQFELTNFLSIHAGKTEDMFRQIKVLAHSFTNRKHFQESFLLNVIKRHEVSRYFKSDSNLKTNRSTVSAAITAFHKRSPIPEIVLTKNFIDANLRDVAGHILRISNFVVSNTNSRYMKLTQNNDLVFPTRKICITQDCDSTCTSCLSQKFPDFPIHNILSSTIEIILDTKLQIYKKISCDIVDTNRASVNFTNLRKILGQDVHHGPAICLSSSQILNLVTIERENPSHQKLPPNHKSMLKSLEKIDPNDPVNFGKLNTSMAKCLAKVLNSVPDSLVALDNSYRRMNILTCNLIEDPNEINRQNHHNELAYKHSRLTDLTDILSQQLLIYQKDIDNLSRVVDKIIESPKASHAVDNINDNNFVKMLRVKQKVKLISLELLNEMNYELKTHNLFFYRPL